MKLAKVKVHSKKRLGRGYGSGKGGHTASRGQKGQKARRHIGILFEGLKMKKSLIKRLPFRRGKDKFKAKDKPMIVNLGALALIPAGSEVSIKTLVDAGIVEKNDANKYGVKILGDGESPKKLTIMLPILSKSAAEKVLAAGGKIGQESTDK
jgi:large subunit ribosomal protein L15